MRQKIDPNQAFAFVSAIIPETDKEMMYEMMGKKMSDGRRIRSLSDVIRIAISCGLHGQDLREVVK